MNEPDCLFCKVVAGDIPAEFVLETEAIVAFRDIDPKAPTHVLVIPKEHVESLESCGEDRTTLLGQILAAARDVARAEGVFRSGYRTVINTGAEGGQTVAHLHLHLLGGRPFAWPPG